MIVWVETLFPDPDSPTIPSVWPASTEYDSPLTARTRPSMVGNVTWRSLTSRSGTLASPSHGYLPVSVPRSPRWSPTGVPGPAAGLQRLGARSVNHRTVTRPVVT